MLLTRHKRPSAAGRDRGRLRPFRVKRAVYAQIRATIGRRRSETGGILGGSLKDRVVRRFEFDEHARRTGGTYSPNCGFLNGLLSEQWNPAGVRILGFVHSHPPYCQEPSHGDEAYAREILRRNPELPELYLPIVLSEAETGAFRLIPFVAVRDGDDVRIERMRLEVVGLDAEETEVAAARIVDDRHVRLDQVQPVITASGVESLESTFCRVKDAYDLPRLAMSRVVLVGVGGAASFAEDLARAGLGEFVLIDPDIVSESNLATQQTYRRDLGQPKVDCLRERILDINPHAIVVTIPKTLEEIDDREFERLAAEPLRRMLGTHALWGFLKVATEIIVPPAATLVCGLTDRFEAQARVNRLALQFGLPSLCAQVYRQGRGAEITFTAPGLTPACHRCALRGRYEAYLKNGFHNNVTSDGTPIFATARLNALKGFVALALLHRGSGHAYWEKLALRIGCRNLIQIRMDPDLPLPVFERVFGGGDRERIVFDDVVWLPQQPDCPANGFPNCPDCGGTGDLGSAAGTFADTRLMR